MLSVVDLTRAPRLAKLVSAILGRGRGRVCGCVIGLNPRQTVRGDGPRRGVCWHRPTPSLHARVRGRRRLTKNAQFIILLILTTPAASLAWWPASPGGRERHLLFCWRRAASLHSAPSVSLPRPGQVSRRIGRRLTRPTPNSRMRQCATISVSCDSLAPSRAFFSAWRRVFDAMFKSGASSQACKRRDSSLPSMPGGLFCPRLVACREPGNRGESWVKSQASKAAASSSRRWFAHCTVLLPFLSFPLGKRDGHASSRGGSLRGRLLI